jgi:hypothetical protein
MKTCFMGKNIAGQATAWSGQQLDSFSFWNPRQTTISRRTPAVFCRAACSTRKSEKEISRIEHKQKASRMRGAFCLCSLGGNTAVG